MFYLRREVVNASQFGVASFIRLRKLSASTSASVSAASVSASVSASMSGKPAIRMESAFDIERGVSMIETQSFSVVTGERLSKQEKKRIKCEHRKEKYIDKRGKIKARLKDMLQSVSYEEKLTFGANKRNEKQRKLENAIQAMNSEVKVCIDLSFNDVNSPREQRSLVKQCTLSYAAVRNSSHGVALHISSLDGGVSEALLGQGMEKWHIRRHTSSVFDVFDRDCIVMLSPDADEVLEKLEADKVYVVGGIVDRTVRNNLTRDRALCEGVEARRLPVKEFFPQSQSHVMNIDQVVALFCVYQETNDWRVLIMMCLVDAVLCLLYFSFVHILSGCHGAGNAGEKANTQHGSGRTMLQSTTCAAARSP